MPDKTFEDRKQEIRDFEASPGWQALKEDLTQWRTAYYAGLLTATEPVNTGRLQGWLMLIEKVLKWPAAKIKDIDHEETVQANRAKGVTPWPSEYAINPAEGDD